MKLTIHQYKRFSQPRTWKLFNETEMGWFAGFNDDHSPRFVSSIDDARTFPGFAHVEGQKLLLERFNG